MGVKTGLGDASDDDIEAIIIAATGGTGDASATSDGVTLTVNSATDTEIQDAVDLVMWAKVRRRRNELLQQSDWTQIEDVPDVPAGIKSKWATYRQSLRQITTQLDPTAIIWPAPPVE